MTSLYRIKSVYNKTGYTCYGVAAYKHCLEEFINNDKNDDILTMTLEEISSPTEKDILDASNFAKMYNSAIEHILKEPDNMLKKITKLNVKEHRTLLDLTKNLNTCYLNK